MKNISGFFCDGYGNLSATRLAFILWTVGVLAVWIYSSLMHVGGPILAPIDPTVVTLLGILMTGKVAQSFSSGDGAAPTPAPVTVAVTPPAGDKS